MRALAALAALAALSLLLAGCGDDDDGAVAGDTETGGTTDDTADAGGAGTSEEAAGFNVQLTGVAEVPGPGDEEGTGTGDVILGDGEACVEVEVSLGSPPQAMHLHEGAVDVAGPVVIDFGAPTEEGVWSTCVEADQSLLDEIGADPSAFYLNVHNADFPDGAVRGQLG